MPGLSFGTAHGMFTFFFVCYVLPDHRCNQCSQLLIELSDARCSAFREAKQASRYAGTNVMLRLRAVYSVARRVESDGTPFQLYSEEEVSEDLELGVRLHAAGYKSVLVCERLSTGEVSWSTFVLLLQNWN